jgi:hypothetical protein
LAFAIFPCRCAPFFVPLALWPVAWRGPLVMNTREELQQAYAELRDGTFIKDH